MTLAVDDKSTTAMGHLLTSNLKGHILVAMTLTRLMLVKIIMVSHRMVRVIERRIEVKRMPILPTMEMPYRPLTV